MRFLVELGFAFPDTLDAEQIDRVVTDERVRGRELLALGHIERIFRLPGRLANVGIWEAGDADVLHDLLTSLPTFPYLSVVRVEPLATHPLEAD